MKIIFKEGPHSETGIALDAYLATAFNCESGQGTIEDLVDEVRQHQRVIIDLIKILAAAGTLTVGQILILTGETWRKGARLEHDSR